MPTALKPPVAAVPQTPVQSAAPSKPQVPRPSCVADVEADGSITITFTVSASAAKIFLRQAEGRDLANFVWDTRGLRHFENQRIV